MNEGDFAQLSCIVMSGDEPLAISWSFHGDQVGQETGITTTNLGSRMSILVINSVGHRHQGKYTCKASNGAGTRTYTTELKVNGDCTMGVRAEGTGITFSRVCINIWHFSDSPKLRMYKVPSQFYTPFVLPDTLQVTVRCPTIPSDHKLLARVFRPS